MAMKNNWINYHIIILPIIQLLFITITSINNNSTRDNYYCKKYYNKNNVIVCHRNFNSCNATVIYMFFIKVYRTGY